MMNVLECLQPKGEIPAHGCAEVEFVFSPLEAKRYQARKDTKLPTCSGACPLCITVLCLPGPIPCTYVHVSLPL